MTIVVRVRMVGPASAELVDRDSLAANAPRPFGFRPKPPALPAAVGLSPGEGDNLAPEQVQTRLGEKVVALVKAHYPDAGAVTLEWLGPRP